MICAAKLVDGVDAAIDHIRALRLEHTDAIVSEDDARRPSISSTASTAPS